MKHIVLYFLCCMLGFYAHAQEFKIDIGDYVNVKLKTGYVIVGKVVEYVEQEHIKIKTKADDIFEYKYSEIKYVKLSQVSIDIKNKRIQDSLNNSYKMANAMKQHYADSLRNVLEVAERKEKADKDEIVRKEKADKDEIVRKEKVALDEAARNERVLRNEAFLKKKMLRVKYFDSLARYSNLLLCVDAGFSQFSSIDYLHLIKGYSSGDEISIPRSVIINCFGVSVDYVKNYSRNLSLIMGLGIRYGTYNKLYSTVYKYSNSLESYSVKIGARLLKGKNIQFITSTGLEYGISTLSTNIIERGDILCAKSSFIGLPLGFTLFYSIPNLPFSISFGLKDTYYYILGSTDQYGFNQINYSVGIQLKLNNTNKIKNNANKNI